MVRDTVVVDTSALLAILLGEEEAVAMAATLTAFAQRWISSFNRLEAEVVTGKRKGPAGTDALLALLHRHGVETIAFTPDHASAASVAYRRYGKGYHEAALNLGDCCAYALSHCSGHPLLFKGEDFARTDVEVATALDLPAELKPGSVPGNQ